MSLWSLPRTAQIGGKNYEIHPDFRDVLEIFSYLSDSSLPEPFRWRIALALFFEGEIPPQYRQEAMEYLADFIRYGMEDRPSPRILDWEQDAGAIIAGVNAVAGHEIRNQPFVHWWTFLSWFSAIGQGELATLVSIRSKLSRGQQLSDWEQDFYRQNRSRVDLKVRYTPEELAQRQRLNALLSQSQHICNEVNDGKTGKNN